MGRGPREMAMKAAKGAVFTHPAAKGAIVLTAQYGSAPKMD